MALVDFNACGAAPQLSWISYDHTIIGCGAIGIHLGLQLAKKGRKVLIIESGQVGEHGDRQALNASILNREDLDGSIHWGRKRALGGSTIRWGGQALPFKKIDFESRPWTQCTQWPIEWDDLAPHYREAETYLGVSHVDYYLGGVNELKLKSPIHSDSLEYHVAKWASEPNMFRRHRRTIDASLDVLYNANCTGVKRNPHRVESIEIRNFSGLAIQIPIQNLVLANGGVESVRSLMAFQLSQSPALGRGFMEHPCMDLGTVQTKNMLELQRYFSTRMIGRQKYSFRISLSETVQKEFQLLNASCGLMFESPPDAPDILDRFKTFLSKKELSPLVSVLGRPNELLLTIGCFLRHGFVYKPHALCRLTVMSEQEPIPTSRLSLDLTEKDQFGIPKLRVDWNISSLTYSSILHLGQSVKSELERSLPVRVQLRPELQSERLHELDHILTPVNHHMGGAIMGTDPESSVVNEQLKIHGLENVFVTSSSVFPSGSHSNPTLTALALGGKLASFLTSFP